MNKPERGIRLRQDPFPRIHDKTDFHCISPSILLKLFKIHISCSPVIQFDISLIFDRGAMVTAADQAGLVVVGLVEDEKGLQ